MNIETLQEFARRGQAAQSAVDEICHEGDAYAAFPCRGNLGLTKREYYAAAAMQGLLANPNYILGRGSGEVSGFSYRDFAEEAIKISDALCTAL